MSTRTLKRGLLSAGSPRSNLLRRNRNCSSASVLLVPRRKNCPSMVVVYWRLLFCQFSLGLRPRMACPCFPNSWRISWRFCPILGPGIRRTRPFFLCFSLVERRQHGVHAHKTHAGDPDSDHCKSLLL